jgi:hypothetical protein
MSLRWTKRFAMLLVAVALGTTSCDSAMSSDSPMSPVTSMASISADGYKVVQATPANAALRASNVIAFGGGALGVGIHSLSVPAGAVSNATIFTMVAPSANRIQVDLSAVSSTVLGLLNVGERGFGKPVVLTLSYENAIGVKDETHLRIGELLSNGEIGEVLETTVDTSAKTVTAKLPHFSTWVVLSD